MISRLTASAAAFAILATAAIAYAAEPAPALPTHAKAADSAKAVIEMPRVEISARRNPTR